MSIAHCSDMALRAMQAALLLLLFTPASGVLAGEISTVVSGKSFHIGSDRDWNENNFGLGVEYQRATQSRLKYELLANAFRDSQDDISYMAGGGLHRNVFSSRRLDGLYVDIGVNAFLMTRQTFNDGRPFPGVLPSLTLIVAQMAVARRWCRR